MINPKFSVFDAVVYALKTVLDNFRLFFLSMLALMGTILVILLPFGFVFGLALVPFFKTLANFNVTHGGQNMTGPELIAQMREAVLPILFKYAPVFILLALIMFVVIVVLVFGFIRLVLTLHDTGSASVTLLFSEVKKFPKALGAWFLYSTIITIGLLLFVVPGLYMIFRFMFFSYFIVDKNSTIIESLKQSWRITQGQIWPLLAINMVIVALSVAGPLIVLFSAPFSITSMVYVYRKLLKSTPELS